MHSVYTEEVNKVVLSSNDNKRIKLIDSIETYSEKTSRWWL